MSATAIRFDEGEKDWIQSYASVLGMSFSEFVRSAALDKVEEAADIKAYKRGAGRKMTAPATRWMSPAHGHGGRMSFSVVWSKAATKQLLNIPKKQRLIILSWVQENLDGCDDPRRAPNGKQLQGPIPVGAGASRLPHPRKD